MTFAPDLRLGRWQDALADVGEVDAVITDPPYSERTVSGFRTGGGRDGDSWQGGMAGTIGYTHARQEDIVELVRWVTEKARHWFVMFGDHVMMRWAEDALPDTWLGFDPKPWVKTDAMPRLQGDGPSPQSESIFIARRRTRVPLRYRPGWYKTEQNKDRIVTGGKPVGLMRQVVRDYSEPGDLVCDPFAGGATTLRACQIEGRRSIGAECDPDTYAKAMDRLRGWGPAESKGTRNLFGGAA
jgi:site-specific DNA-methyltransferase (adenine-specific)